MVAGKAERMCVCVCVQMPRNMPQHVLLLSAATVKCKITALMGPEFQANTFMHLF